MEYSDRFRNKFQEQFQDIDSENDDNIYLAWESIIRSEKFAIKDLLEILDYLNSERLQGELIIMDHLYLILITDPIFDELLFEFSQSQIEKYSDFFLSLNSFLSLNDTQEAIVFHYGKKIDWQIILQNTLYENIDGQLINNHGYYLVKEYHHLMFSNEIVNDTYNPASSLVFFECLESGAEIAYDYLKDSIINNNTTFSSDLRSIIHEHVENYMNGSVSPLIELSLSENSEENKVVLFSTFQLVSRAINDDELMNFLEHYEGKNLEEAKNGIVYDFDPNDDDLGF